MDEGLAMDSGQRNTLNLNVLYYFSQVGDRYYSLVLPAIAFFFSENIHELKYTISVYFFFTAVLQVFPEILTQKTGFKKGILIYFTIFLAGTLIGFFYQGGFWVIACSRALQAIGLSVLPLLVKSLMYADTDRVKSFMIWRNILSGLAGPTIAVAFGYVLHYYNWRIFYLLIGALYLLALLWFYFKFADVELDGEHQKSLKGQLRNTLSIFKHTRLVLLAFCGILAMSIGTFIYSVYAFVFLHDFHLQVYYVGYIPLLFTISTYITMLFIPLLKKFSADKVVTVILLTLPMIALLFWVLPTTEWITILCWMLLMSTCDMLYVFLNEVMAKIAKESNKIVQLNALYYFLKNIIPMIAILIWAHFGEAKQIDMVKEIIFSFGLGSLLLYMFIKKGNKRF